MPRTAGPFLLLLASACTSADLPSSPLAGRLDALIGEAAGERVQVSVLVVSLPGGGILYQRHPRLLLHPASNMKLLTVATAVALGLHGAEVVTRLVSQEDRDGAVLRLVGGGDPFLGRADLARLARELARRRPGLRIRELLADRSLFSGPRFGTGWMWDDEPAAFMPHLSALTVEEGCVAVVVDPEHRPPVSLEPASEHLALVDATGGDAPLVITRDWQEGGRTITVSGALPAGRVVRRLSVPEPDLFAARVLKHELQARGLVAADLPVAASPPSGEEPGDVVGRIARPMAAILQRLNKESHNLAAESLLRHLALAAGRPRGTAAGGLEQVRRYVRTLGLDPGHFRLVDGSGVSHYNLVSAELLVRVLVDMYRREATRELFRGTLPVAGRDGTLKDRMRSSPVRGRVQAKTGTISGVSTLSGYVTAPHARPVAFSILIQNFVGSPRPWRALQDRICTLLVEHIARGAPRSLRRAEGPTVRPGSSPLSGKPRSTT